MWTSCCSAEQMWTRLDVLHDGSPIYLCGLMSFSSLTSPSPLAPYVSWKSQIMLFRFVDVCFCCWLFLLFFLYIVFMQFTFVSVVAFCLSVFFLNQVYLERFLFNVSKTRSVSSNSRMEPTSLRSTVRSLRSRSYCSRTDVIQGNFPSESLPAKVLERKPPSATPKRRWPDEGYQTSDPKRRFTSDGSQSKSQTKVSKPRAPTETAKTNVPKRKFLAQVSRRQNPNESSRQDSRRTFPSVYPSSHAEVATTEISKRRFSSNISSARVTNRKIQSNRPGN